MKLQLLSVGPSQFSARPSANGRRAMPLADKNAKVLWAHAAGFCSNPSCRQALTETLPSGGVTHYGEHAHIIAESPDGPRGIDESGVRPDTDSYENYILLCPTCHTKIDKSPESYPAGLLREWKRVHEARMISVLAAEISKITFDELEKVCDAVVASEGPPLELGLTPPLEKMHKNELTGRLESTIRMGLSQAETVRSFLAVVEETDSDFPERLVEGFRRQYHLAMSKGLNGDALFAHLVARPAGDIPLQAAQIAVVSYLFHSCDLFET